MNMRNIIAILALLSLVFCAGCGTVLTHGGDPGAGGPRSGVYRGIRWDGMMVATFEHDLFSPGSKGSGGMPDIFLLDFPFSAIADTVLLPYDLTTVNAEKSQ